MVLPGLDSLTVFPSGKPTLSRQATQSSEDALLGNSLPQTEHVRFSAILRPLLDAHH
jgi:hypothetical protein